MSGRKTRTVAMEQLPDVCLRRRGLGKSQLSGMAVEDNVFRIAVPLIRNPRMSGAPRLRNALEGRHLRTVWIDPRKASKIATVCVPKGSNMDIEIVETPVEAEAALRRLVSGGYDLFRGQRNDWPPIASLWRTLGVARESALAKMEQFRDWCSSQPLLSPYFSDSDQLVAIAQHYGLPTSFLDVTSSAEIALYFALENASANPGDRPVVFAWKKSDCEHRSDIRLINPIVPNLWRLEAQRGLFLETNDGVDIFTVVPRCHKIVITNPQPSKRLTREIVYPIRKSLLETILDIYFYRELTEETLKLFTRVKFVSKKRWRSYEAAFKDRQIVVRPETFEYLDPRWFVRVSVSYDSVVRHSGQCVRLDVTAHNKHWEEEIAVAVSEFERSGIFPDFAVAYTSNPRHDAEISKAFNNTFDGIVAHPYSRSERIACLKNCIYLLPVVTAKDLSDAEKHIQDVIGEYVICEFAALGGAHNSCDVSKRILEGALDPEAFEDLRPFFKRYVDGRRLEVLCFSLEHLHTFLPSKFITLFAEQAIPTQFAWYLREHLQLLTDGGATWDIVFDPLALGYFSLSKYQSSIRLRWKMI
jgi:FRG domain